jgi:large subunit ribosomal protein L15
MPLQRRLPKRGFTNIFREEYAVVNVSDLERFEADTVLDRRALEEAGLVKRARVGIKLLGHGNISHPLVVRVNRVSSSAREKVEAVGGKIELI